MWKSPDFPQLLLFMLFRYMFVLSTSVENRINLSESEAELYLRNTYLKLIIAAATSESHN